MQISLSSFNRLLFFTALPLNFYCILSYTSNTLALSVLAFCCLLTFLEAEKPRFSWYHALFLLFIGYIYLHGLLVFPEEQTFAFRRKAVLAFMAGIAAFQLLKKQNMGFMYLMNLVLPFVIAGVAALTAFGYISYESLFIDNGARLVLRANHPTTLGMMLCVCLVTGLRFLLCKDAGSAPPLATGRSPIAFLRRAAQSKALVLCGMLLSALLLFPTLSKTALFSTVIVCGLFSAYMVCKRWGLLRLGIVFAVLAMLAAGGWRLAPIETGQKERFYNAVLSNALTPWEYGTFISRIPIWESSVLAVKEHPLFGVGTNGFAAFHQNRVRADYDRLVAIYGRHLVDSDTAHTTTPHNVYLLWFAQTGIIGGTLFCLLLFIPLFYCLKKRTLYGEIGLILAAFAIDFFFDDLMTGGRASSFCVTIIFMTFGYFGGLLGQRRAGGSEAVSQTFASGRDPAA